MEYDEGIDWRKPLAVLALLIFLCAVGIVVMGTQVSAVLSTVGAPVGIPGRDYQVPGGNDGGDGGADGGGAGAGEEPGGGDTDAGPPGEPGAGALALLDVARPELLIIKNGSIQIQAAEIDPTLAAATAQVTSLGGYAAASERTGDGEASRASITFRMPSDRWEEAVVAIRAIGERVLDERTETVDVTGQVVDLRARIQNLETTERALQAIMDRATAIKDVLDVQAQLTKVRGEIEQLEARAAGLEEQAAMSTLTLEITLRPTSVIAEQEARFDPGTEAEFATAQLVGILQALATAGIWFGIVWLPLLVAIAIVGGTGYVIVRRFRRSPGQGEPPMATAPGGSA